MNKHLLPGMRFEDKRAGFTLIEILIVIAIISLLAAILFPVFSRARENARRASCQSNLKQLALSIHMYNADNDQRFPIGARYDSTEVPGHQSGTPNYGLGWASTVYPYVKTIASFHCPDDTTKARLPNVANSYAINLNIAAGPKYLGEGTPESLFSDEARTILLSEVRINVVDITLGRDLVSATTNGMMVSSATTYQGEARCDMGYLGAGLNAITLADGSGTCVLFGAGNSGPFGRHLDGANYAFCDGHVKWLFGRTVSPGYFATNPGDPEGTSSRNAAGTQALNGGLQATYSPR